MNLFETPTSKNGKKIDNQESVDEGLSRKEKELKKIRKFVDNTDDDLGLEIDENIKEAIKARKLFRSRIIRQA